MTNSLRINTPSVTHQTIDGEVIILNLDNGYYYSLTNTAALIWQICDNSHIDAIVDKIVGYYQNSSEEIAGLTRDFLEELMNEALLVPQTDSANLPPAFPAELSNGVGSRQFVAPVLEKYTEMSDLLLIDPIHDVDAAGWPYVHDETKTSPVPRN